VRTSLFCHPGDEIPARAESARTRTWAEQSKQITDRANVTGGGGPDNAFQAAQAVEAYEFFEKACARQCGGDVIALENREAEERSPLIGLSVGSSAGLEEVLEQTRTVVSQDARGDFQAVV